jgi:hypothetical protein
MGALFTEHDEIDEERRQNEGDKNDPQPEWRNALHE